MDRINTFYWCGFQQISYSYTARCVWKWSIWTGDVARSIILWSHNRLMTLWNHRIMWIMLIRLAFAFHRHPYRKGQVAFSCDAKQIGFTSRSSLLEGTLDLNIISNICRFTINTGLCIKMALYLDIVHKLSSVQVIFYDMPLMHFMSWSWDLHLPYFHIRMSPLMKLVWVGY